MLKVGQINVLLAENNGDYFAVAKRLDSLYGRGIITEEAYLEYMDILAAKGIANKWR